jgi:hypothetical protein
MELKAWEKFEIAACLDLVREFAFNYYKQEIKAVLNSWLSLRYTQLQRAK